MRRRTKPPIPKVKAKPPSARKSLNYEASRVRDLEKRLAEALKDKAEALEQQTATSEILRVISQSQTDVQPVFDTIVRNAVRLCGALHGGVYRFDGELVHSVAHDGYTLEQLEEWRATWPKPVTAPNMACQAIRTRRPVRIRDLETAPELAMLTPETRANLRARGSRSVMAVPMFRRDEVIGAISLAHPEVDAFSDVHLELLKTFADQAVIAIENVRLFTELQVRNRQLTDSLDQQTATSEILRTIAHAQTDTQPVFDTIVRSAARLCHAANAALFLTHGGMLYEPANYGSSSSPEALAATRARYPRPVGMDTTAGMAVLTRSVIHVPDAEDPSAIEHVRQGGRLLGFRGMVTVPMLREGEPVGAIIVTRREPGRFSGAEVELLKTFADQAVIAIENVRLFKELETRNAELTTALDRQTATSEILRVISGAQQDAQAVFDTIVQSAVRLCRATTAAVFRVEDGVVYHPANYGGDPEALAAARARYPRPVDIQTMPGMIVLARSVVQIPDSEEVGLPDHVRQVGRILGFRSVVGVPMLREGEAVGALLVTRREPGRFSDPEVELLKTFSDQAVIAIENVRLFTELQASNRELTTALDTQTATSDILRVISRSQTDVQPVFDAIVTSAVRLLGAYSGVLTRIKGDQIELGALTSTNDVGDAAARALYPEPLQSERATARAIRERAPINVADAHTDRRLPETEHARARVRGYQSLVVVPMLRDDEAVGTIAVTRREPGGFTDDEIALLKTFADQAVIAIENARLLTELQARTQELSRSVGELQALGEVGQAISSTLDLETVLTTIVSRAVQLSGLDGGVVFEYDTRAEEFVHRAATETGGTLAEARRSTRVRRGEGVVGQTALTLEPAQVPDITVPGAYDSRLRGNLIESGVRAILAVPMVREGQLIGCLVVSRNHPGDFPAETIELLRTFATQSALAIQNARLFQEIADKSHQLEIASQHKSEFLANMSHELRTPLNAIIGFSEVLAQGMFGDINEKQTEYLHDILESGRHLLSLINDILDLSKIEAGRMELEAADFDLPNAIENALVLVRERAIRRGIRLGSTIDTRLGMISADERKVKQVLLNLLSNALKFTPEGGQIDVAARLHDDRAEVSVADTGIGIAPTDQDRVFEEFRQVGTADKKAEGTGLGLTLSRKFIELHGGRIWVKSQVGMGSTFTFTLPVTHGR